MTRGVQVMFVCFVDVSSMHASHEELGFGSCFAQGWGL
jgi:hypothetical protein